MTRLAFSRALAWRVVRRFGRSLAAGLALSVTASTAVAAQSSAIGRTVDSLAARGFSGVVLVGTRDTVLFERAVGLADREAGRPLRADAVWRWASVTKQVTAALVMREVDAGRVALDSPVVRFLPEFAGPTARVVTVRQLLQHTSGLPNPEDSPADADEVQRFYRAPGAVSDAHREALRGYCASAPKRAPGASFEYNNCDYLVLGALLERVTGRPYATLVAELIGTTASARADEVTGYLEKGERQPSFNLATFGAAAALTGTARELLAFDRLLMDDQLLTPAGKAEMWRGEPKIGYAALGAWVFPARLRGCAAPVTLVERRGEILGVQVRNVIAPALGRALIVFTNDGAVQFGEIWQGAGLSHALVSASLCGD